MRHAFPSLALALALAVPGTAHAGDSTFRTPSGYIGCGYYDGSLRCDVRDGIRPEPPKPSGCELDWGQGFWLKRHGRATVVCAGDTMQSPENRNVVKYGTTWRGDGIACASSPNGLRCTNADGHGFFMSRGSSYSF